MYAYCQNNPVMYYDDTGHAIKSNIGYYCDGGGEWIQVETDGSELADSYKDYLLLQNSFPTFDGHLFISIEQCKNYRAKAYDVAEIIDSVLAFGVAVGGLCLPPFWAGLCSGAGVVGGAKQIIDSIDSPDELQPGTYATVKVVSVYPLFDSWRSCNEVAVYQQIKTESVYAACYDMATGTQQWICISYDMSYDFKEIYLK